MKKSVYLETTVISYLVARPSRDVIRAARQAVTRRWWNDRRQDFDLFVSEVVFEEAGKGDKCAAERRKQILERLTRLEISGEVAELAAALVEKGSMPQKAAGRCAALGRYGCSGNRLPANMELQTLGQCRNDEQNGQRDHG